MNGIHRGGSGFGSALLIGAAGAVVAVALFQVPLATVFTFGLVLICPLMMFGMHGSHGRTHEDGASTVDRGSHQHVVRR